MLKGKMEAFNNAFEFKTEAFFSKDQIKDFWHNEEYTDSYFHVDKDGVITNYQNIGFYFKIYDENGNLDRWLGAVTKFKIRYSL